MKALLNTKMTIFPTLFYTSAREIPTFMYLQPKKKGLLSDRVSPYSPLEGVLPFPGNNPRNSQTGDNTLYLESRMARKISREDSIVI